VENGRDNKPSIAVLAPMFDRRNERDGYIQRVKSIDQNVLSGFYRIHLVDKGAKAKRLYAFDVDEGHAEVFFNGFDPAQREKVQAMIDQGAGLYAHSLFQLMNPKGEPSPLFANAGVLKIWDVHGAGPEECLLSGQEEKYAPAQRAEAYAYAHADVIVTLNQTMKAHLQTKHGPTGARFVCIPYFGSGEWEGRQAPPAEAEGKPAAVYAGGVQPWQNMEKIRDLVKKTRSLYAYRFFVPDPKQLRKQWAAYFPAEEIQIGSIPPHRMREAYDRCQYGLLFREDIAVNNVACPAKLIEYMQNGVVPVLLSDRIGDFAALGMRYVAYEDFAQGRIPAEEERARMAEDNRQVLKRLEQDTKAGCGELGRMLETKRK